MKFLFTLALTMSFIAFAQEEESYKYQPETNKAESDDKRSKHCFSP